MSDSLRDALEKRLTTLPVMAYGNGYLVEALPKAELLSLLAAHPAEPAPAETCHIFPHCTLPDGHAGWCEKPAPVQVEIADEAVVAAERAYETFGAGMRDALEAALPYLSAQPVSSRERVAEVARTLLVDVSDPDVAIDKADSLSFADALLAAGVFRELPTREAVREEIRAGLNTALCNGGHPETGWSPSAEVDRITDAVLNLLGGAE